MFLYLGDKCVSEEFHGSFWSSCECFLPLHKHRENECDIPMIDFHRYAFYCQWFDETDHIFEEFLIDSHDHIECPYSRLLCQFIELHSAVVKEWIIIGIADFKFYRLSWIIDGFELINALWRWAISCQIPVKGIDIKEFETGHLSCVKFDDKCCPRKSSTRSELIAILIEEEYASRLFSP
jgi:hypothetical protein